MDFFSSLLKREVKNLSNVDIIGLTSKHVANTYGRFPISIVRGKGTRVWDADGREYLDFVSGLAVCNLGHCHPNVVKAIQQQAEKLMAPDGELQKHRHAVQQLSTQALQTTASLETLRKEQAALDDLREQFRQSQAAVRESTDRTEGLRSDFDQLRGIAFFRRDSGQGQGKTGAPQECGRQDGPDAANQIELEVQPHVSGKWRIDRPVRNRLGQHVG